MAKPVNFSNLSPRAQAFFADRAAAKKSSSKRGSGSKKRGSKSGKGGGS